MQNQDKVARESEKEGEGMFPLTPASTSMLHLATKRYEYFIMGLLYVYVC